MVFVDNQLGVSYQIGKDRDECWIKFYDSYIFGESDDIPLDCVGDDCLCVEKNGLTLFGHNFKTKEIHITGESALPLYKVKSEAGWGMFVDIQRVTFQNFKSANTLCGSSQRIFHNSKTASDYIPMHELKDCTFIDVDERAYAKFDEPKEEWAKIDDCGEWPCTAPENIVIRYEGSKYSGTSISNTMADGTVTYALGDDPFYGNCDYNSAWNAWQCADRDIGVLLFESLDGDTYDRSVQPVYISDDNGSYTNKLNSNMDHVWDGFYTGQTRLSRFPAQI